MHCCTLPDKRCLPLSGNHDVALSNDDPNDAESTQKSKIASLSLVMGKLINRIPGTHLSV